MSNQFITIEHEGRSMSLQEFAQEHGLLYATVYYRYCNDLPLLKKRYEWKGQHYNSIRELAKDTPYSAKTIRDGMSYRVRVYGMTKQEALDDFLRDD